MFTIRPAEPADQDALGRLGALLMRTHFVFDRRRFLDPGAHPERAYGAFLASRLGEPDERVLVGVRDADGAVVGYAWAGVEPLSWKELRDRAGFVHDVAVDPSFRRHGLAARLVEEAAGWLVAQGVPRVMLWAAAPNEPARRLFARLGFRETMVEMTREADEGALTRDPGSR